METQNIRSARGGAGGVSTGAGQPAFPWTPGGSAVSEDPGMDRWTLRPLGAMFRPANWLGWKSRAEPPNSPQMESRPGQIPSWQQPRNLTPVTPAGASWRENRLADRMGVDPWVTRHIMGPADGGMNYGPPPRPEIAHAFEIPRLFRRANWGWAGLQQQGYVQDQRGGAKGTGAYIPHPGQNQPTRGWRSVSMARIDSPRPFASDRVHIPAIFVPTAPIS